MSYHKLILYFFIVISVWADSSRTAVLEGAEKNALPNIVFIFADDMGYGDISRLNENSKIKTPNLDSLAREGMIFTDAHAAASVCGPSRYAVMTGRYPMRNRMKSSNNSNGFAGPVIEKNRLTVAQMLKDKGYDTAAFGKWHLGMVWPTKDGKPLGDPNSESEWARIDYSKPITEGPLSQGFDYYFGIAASLDMVPYVFIENDHVTEIPTKIKQNDPPRPGPAGEIFEPIQVLPALTEKSIAYIDDHGPSGKRHEHPFFIYLPLNAPHTPLVPMEKWQGKTVIGPYGDYCLQVDDSVGQILAALDRNGLRENTLVIFTVDNGFAPYVKPEPIEEKGHFPSYIYRGYKTDIYDGGHRMPFFASWPGKIAPNSISNDLICLSDFMRTCADIVDYRLPDNAAEDSISFLPILLDKSTETKRTNLVHLAPKNRVSIREGQWKLIIPTDATPNPPQWKQAQPRELYNMASDPSEKNNIVGEHPDVVSTLAECLQKIIDNGRSTVGPPQINNAKITLDYFAGEKK